MKIEKYKDFILENNNEIKNFLVSLNNKEIDDLLSQYEENLDKEILNDILIELDDLVDEKKYQWVSKKINEL